LIGIKVDSKSNVNYCVIVSHIDVSA